MVFGRGKGAGFWAGFWAGFPGYIICRVVYIQCRWYSDERDVRCMRSWVAEGVDITC